MQHVHLSAILFTPFPLTLFALLLQFSHLLEEGQGRGTGGKKGRFSRTSEKQLKWEDSREVGHGRGRRQRQHKTSGAAKKGNTGRQMNGKGFHRKKLGRRTKRK